MAKSVQQLRRESEQSRAELSSTVEALRDRISEKTSPDNIKAEVRDYVADKATGWLDQLKQQAMDNPLQALAAGSAIALPVLRLARAIPLPMLLVGSGFVLSSSKLRAKASETIEPALQPVKEYLGTAGERAQSLSEDAVARASDLSDQARRKAHDLRDSAAAGFDVVRGQAADAMASLQPRIDQAKTAAAYLQANAGETLKGAPETAAAFIQENAVLIGGLGLAIGAIIAASLPATSAEAKAAATVGAGARRAAGAAARSGIEAAKGVVVSAADAALETVKEADLGRHASRMAKNFADTLKDVAADAVTTAFDPSRTPNQSEEAGHD